MTDDIVIAGCRFPAGLAYDVAHHVWYAAQPDGTWRLGITAVAVALANHRIFAMTPRRAGRAVEAGRACATIESSKWVGPVRIAFDAQVVAANHEAEARPDLVATDPYGAGWILLARPTGPVAGLLLGEAMRAAYAKWMRGDDFPGCEGVF